MKKIQKPALFTHSSIPSSMPNQPLRPTTDFTKSQNQAYMDYLSKANSSSGSERAKTSSGGSYTSNIQSTPINVQEISTPTFIKDQSSSAPKDNLLYSTPSTIATLRYSGTTPSPNPSSSLFSSTKKQVNFDLSPEKEFQEPRSSNYDDDEPLPNFMTKTKFEESKTFEIKNLFNLNLKLRKNIIKSNPIEAQSFPLLARIQSYKPPNFEKSPVDIVCVIDKSGSMEGVKLQEVKQALKCLIELLDENDRLSIVSFDHDAVRETKLLCMTKENKEKTLKSIGKITSSGGGTSIGNGMEQALWILKNRKEINTVSGIFLLSDGLDENGLNFVNSSLEQINISESFSIHTFGFGNDHDPKLMSDIADLKDGNFYFIENPEIVDQAFLNCFGGLAGCFAKDGELIITPQKNSIFDEKICITRAVGDQSNWSRKGDSYSIKISHIMAEQTLNFVLKIRIPKNDKVIKTDFEKQINVVEAVFKFKDLKGNSYEISKKLSIHMLNEDEEPPKIRDDKDVIMQYYRAKVGEILAQARKLAEHDEYFKANKLLEDFRLELELCVYKTEKLMKAIIQDVERAKEYVDPNKFEINGRHNLYTVARSQAKERFCFQSSLNHSSPQQYRYQMKAYSAQK